MSSSSGFWWWSSSSGGASADFDRLLETCTSSNLPSSTPPPITHSLTLSDLIRSSAVSSSHAVKSLQKRLAHPNPNVQLLVISVIDVCVKNGGDGFIKQIGCREFSEDCAQIISNPISNTEVKEKLKHEFQNWALAFEAVPFLASSELVITYRRLKTLGIDFPPRDPLATAAMVDSMSAPEWRDSDVCDRCRTAFSFTNRKHHCRNCGGVFDGQCSSKKRALPHFGVAESVRICDGCERSLAAGVTDPTKTGRNSIRRNSFSGEPSLPSPAKLSFSQNNHYRSATIHSGTSTRANHRYTSSTPAPYSNSVSREEADVERAIALSLQVSTPAQQPSFPHSDYASSYPSYIEATSKPLTSTGNDETNDPDLAAAIEASLRDVQVSSNPHPSAPMPVSPSIVLETLPSRSSISHQNDREEFINTLLNFSADVDTATRLGQLFPTNIDLNNKHAQAEAARLDLNKGIQNAERKTQILREMNDKLSQAVKLYDHLLRDQIQYRTGHTESSATSSLSYATYAQMPPFQSDPHYRRISDPVSMSINNQASAHLPHNSTAPYPVHAGPVGQNFTSAPPNILTSSQTSHTAYPAPHRDSSHTQQYSYPALLQPTAPFHRNTPAMAQQNQSPFSQECLTVGLTQPPPTAASNTALSPTPKSPCPENALPHDSRILYGPPANALGNSPGSGIQLPPAMSQSPVTFTATPTVHLTEHNQYESHASDQFSSYDHASSQSSQQVSHGHQVTKLPPVSRLDPPQESAFQSTQQLSPQPVSSAFPPHQMSSAEFSSFNQNKHSGQEFHNATGFLASSSSAPQTSIEPSLTNPSYFPSFPNVPNTQLAWSSNTSPGSYHHTGIDVSSVRQEEVAPLIEL